MKYKCKNCNYGPCSITTPGCMVPTFACPFLDKQTKWLLSKDPPQAEDDGIVKAAKDYETILQTRGVSDKELKEARVRIAQAIEVKIEELQDDYNSLCEAEQDHAKRFAGIEDSWLASENRARKAEIEAVRKLFRNHESRITAIETLAPVLDQQILDLDADTTNLERKVEELEEGHEELLGLFRALLKKYDPDAQPQPVVEDPERSRRAQPQAPDSDGKLHPLIPGQSVIDCPAGVRIFHHYNPKEQCSIYGYLIRDGKIENELSNCVRAGTTHVFDLSFPPFESQDVGGDK